MTDPLHALKGTDYSTPFVPDKYSRSIFPYTSWIDGVNPLSGYIAAQGYDHIGASTGHPGPPYRAGGAFGVVHLKTFVMPSFVNAVKEAFGSQLYKGYVWSTFPSFASLAVRTNMQTESFTYGATGYARARPDAPIMNLGVSLVELRELPAMTRRLNSAAQNVANGRPLRGANAGAAFLEWKFGYDQLIRDLMKLLNVQARLDLRYVQLKRDAGQRVRRGSTIVNDASISTSTGSGGGAGMASTTAMAVNYEDVYSITKRIWFSGAFRYFVPPNEVESRDTRFIRQQLGLGIDANLLYHVTPWTWLFDWFTGLGDAVSNAQLNRDNNTVSDYAYIMNHYRQSHIRTTRWTLSNGTTFGTSAGRYIDQKTREGASPYGFGLHVGDLNANQIAILAALGISRAF
jgi:hypothetical protein